MGNSTIFAGTKVKEKSMLDSALNLFPTKIVIDLEPDKPEYAQVYYSYMYHPLEHTNLCDANHVFAQLFSAKLTILDEFVYTVSNKMKPSSTGICAKEVKENRLFSMAYPIYVRMESLGKAIQYLICASASYSMLIPLFLRYKERIVFLNGKDMFQQLALGNVDLRTEEALAFVSEYYKKDIYHPEVTIQGMMNTFEIEVQAKRIELEKEKAMQEEKRVKDKELFQQIIASINDATENLEDANDYSFGLKNSIDRV